MSESSPLTSHVLNTADGVPAARLPLSLHRLDPRNMIWTLLSVGTTNEDGRCAGLISREAFVPGMYKLRFETGTYWESLGQSSFYPYVEVPPQGAATRCRHKVSPQGATTRCRHKVSPQGLATRCRHKGHHKVPPQGAATRCRHKVSPQGVTTSVTTRCRHKVSPQGVTTSVTTSVYRGS
ncbi:hypothetical protein JOQ06_017278 [Pogonophryne albipinna]|uniref:Transthyretin n=1 Tax=Pogonophryne albipinna TaxID=1090488 RepID=A0AAD6FHS6_9TELE|nr:hypothetical protein JOQ06_017278 [Pogonophryne albipinna]